MYGVDRVSRFLQGGDESFGFSHLSGEQDARRLAAQQALAFQECLILGNAAELQGFLFGVGGVGVEKLFQFPHHGCFGLLAVQCLSVDLPADVGQQVAVVPASAAVQIAFDGGHRDGVGRDDFIGRISGHGRDDGEAVVGGLLYLCPLFFRDAESHAVDEHGIVLADIVQFLPVKG